MDDRHGRPGRARGWRNGARTATAAGSLLLAAVLAGCGAGQRLDAGGGGTGPAIPAGSSSHAISVGGASRTFRVYRPAALPAAAPLVVMLHGGFGTGAQAERSYHWDAAAVELIAIAGAGHQWPGAAPDWLAQKLLHTDPPSTALNATQVIWQFFAAHPRPRSA